MAIRICSGSLIYHDEYPGFGSCNQYIPQMIAAASGWNPNYFTAEYCLSETVVGTCGFTVNLVIILVVAICNIGKLSGMLYVAFGAFQDPLITIGDAVSSFLENPDRTTKSMCITTKKDILFGKRGLGWWEVESPKVWKPMKRRWLNAASKSRWWMCMLL